MSKVFSPDRLDVAAFARAGARLASHDPLANHVRLMAEAAGPLPEAVVHWEAAGEQRQDGAGQPEPWLHLFAQTQIPLVCQRCLGPVQVPLEVDRWFRFAPDEATAAALDEDSEDDVLAVSREFDLAGLVEDELLMALPVTPLHATCPQSLPQSAADPDFDEAQGQKPNPFAALSKLKN